MMSLLGDLCSVWYPPSLLIHTNPPANKQRSHATPKYRCPGCSARTCSVTCSKRHKARAQCGGVRNPATFIRRSELATPSAFDRDFNFIAGLERKIEGAEREMKRRGITVFAPTPCYAQTGPMKGEVNRRKALDRCGVIVDRAPPGMSRSRQNQTSWDARCVLSVSMGVGIPLTCPDIAAFGGPWSGCIGRRMAVLPSWMLRSKPTRYKMRMTSTWITPLDHLLWARDKRGRRSLVNSSRPASALFHRQRARSRRP